MKYMLIALALSAFAFAASAAEFHVAPGGNDANPGTADKPFASLIHARDAARAAGGTNAILLAPGRYFHEASIVLDERDNGLTIKGERPGATAEVYGGVPVTGWKRWKSDIWRAPVPKGARFFNLIVDDQPATMAQWPKAGSGYGGGFTRGKKLNEEIVVPREFLSCDFSEAQVRTWVDQDWFTEVRKVLTASPDADGVLKVDPGSMRFCMNPHFYVRGVLEFLTEPGEWCLKAKEGYVYYRPKTGTPANHLIVRADTQRVFDIEGRKPQTPAKHITLANLSIIGSDFCERWYLFSTWDASTPEPLQQGMVFGENVEALKISGCRLLAAGQAGVWFNRFAKDCVVENCLIMHTGFAGVYANGFEPGVGPFKSAADSYVNKGHRIENNFIFDVCRLAGGSGGIQFYQSGDALIARNEISQSPRYAISFKGERWGCLPRKMYGHDLTFASHWDYLHTRNIKVIGNDLHNVCRDSFDYGVIESWSPGRDNLWANNAVHDNDSAVEWSHGLQVFFTDDASHYTTIRNNIVDHCQGGGAGTMVTMLKSIGQVFENNLVVDCMMSHPIWVCNFIEPGGDTTIRRNVFANTVMAAPVLLSRTSAYAGTAGTQFSSDIVNIKELDYNAIQPWHAGQGNTLADKGFDTHSFFGDPKVLRAKPDWDITFRDYSLATDSPALKLGFKPIDTSCIGLRPDFPFDVAAATRRLATDKIQAEDYERMHELQTIGGYGIRGMSPGSWAKYANIDFGSGDATHAVFQLDVNSADANASRPFIRRYADTVVEATPFKGDASVETIARWEVSKPYTKPGKSGPELYNEVLPPEQDIAAGIWTLPLASSASRGGVVNFNVANGKPCADACGYARASIYAPIGRSNAKMTVSAASGVKVWLNGNLLMAHNKPGTYSEISKGIIKQGWNTILVKVSQDIAQSNANETGDGKFWFKFGTIASSCGAIVYLAGLPTDERAAHTSIELRLDAPTGPLIGSLSTNQTECPIHRTTGIHNLFLVFLDDSIKQIDYLRMK